MKEFIEKLISRLEESGQKMCEAKSSIPFGKHSSANHRYYKAISVKKAIHIINQLAEEYKECDLCYFANPCEYQNKDIRMPDVEFAVENGWIPCSERLPEDKQKCLTTAEIHFVPDHVDEPDSYIGVEINTYSKRYGWLYNQDVIAWQPLPAPYQPKVGDA